MHSERESVELASAKVHEDVQGNGSSRDNTSTLRILFLASACQIFIKPNLSYPFTHLRARDIEYSGKREGG